ncbi:MAG: fimbrillin family protein, partial [Kiritimatiellae bacterium]|nr:fimbrillin family protein [Kiritimatiellia bacterium]
MIAFAFFAAAACSKERLAEPLPHGEAIAFSSFRKQVYTKADIELFDFEPGTKYTLLAVAAGSDRWETGKGFAAQPQIGIESSSHTIVYEPTSVFRSGENLDFYGLTYGTETAPELLTVPADGTTPVIEISEVDDRLPDLMHSNDPEARNRNSAGGTVILPFEHALSAVNILLSKQDESADEAAAKQLLDVRVTDLTLKNVAESAQMDVVTGEWTWETVGNRTIFHDTEGYAVNETAGYIGMQDLLLVPSTEQQIIL